MTKPCVEEIAILEEMVRNLQAGPSIYHPSPFWRKLVALHLKSLEMWGFENFKRTLNTQYFNWEIPSILYHQIFSVAWNWLKSPDISIFSTKFPNWDRPRGNGIASMQYPKAFLYRVYVSLLAHMVSREDSWKLLELLEEPQVGNPWCIRWKGRRISQDLCNSIHEFYSSWGVQHGGRCPVNVAELGAGYGRLAYVFLNAVPQVNYCIIDIPPALFIAQRYLMQVFPQEKVFQFRPFSSYEHIKNEFEAARIRFLLAPQIELLPAKQFDLIINISSLHEMTRQQIAHYFSEIDRLGRGLFYTKQWRKSRAPGNELVAAASHHAAFANVNG